MQYVEDMNLDEDKHKVSANSRLRQYHYTPDSLRVGVWTFAMLLERKNVLKLVLRLEDSVAKDIEKHHTGFKVAPFPKGEDWFDLIVDGSYVSKQDIYDVLEKSYEYVFNRYYHFDVEAQGYFTDEELAVADEIKVYTETAERAKDIDEAFEQAIAEYAQAVEAYKARGNSNFRCSRIRLLAYVKKYELEGTTIVEREKLYRPASLKLNGRTYCMIYERKGEVKLIIRCSIAYAKKLEKFHPEVFKARFPKGRNWFVVMADQSYKSTLSVYRVVRQAFRFVKGGEIPRV